jgi:hypothetical protein
LHKACHPPIPQEIVFPKRRIENALIAYTSRGTSYILTKTPALEALAFLLKYKIGVAMKILKKLLRQQNF